MKRWRWVLRGNGNLSVLCKPVEDGTFARHGTSYYHFVIGSIHDEITANNDCYQRIFVKIGLCEGCYNAGPAGFDCIVCPNAEDCPCEMKYGAIRVPCDKHKSDISKEIDPLHVVQRMNRCVLKISTDELEKHFGEDAGDPMENKNGYYFEWQKMHEALLNLPAQFTHNRPRGKRDRGKDQMPAAKKR